MKQIRRQILSVEDATIFATSDFAVGDAASTSQAHRTSGLQFGPILATSHIEHMNEILCARV